MPARQALRLEPGRKSIFGLAAIRFAARAINHRHVANPMMPSASNTIETGSGTDAGLPAAAMTLPGGISPVAHVCVNVPVVASSVPKTGGAIDPLTSVACTST